MDTQKEKIYKKLLKTVIYYNYYHNAQFFNENFRQAISTIMAEMVEKKLESKHNANNVNMDPFCQSLATTNTQGKIANDPNKKRISSKILPETIKLFKGLTLDSTINDSTYYHLEEDDAESDPNSDPKVATHTSDGKKNKSLILTPLTEILHTNY